MIGNRHRQTAQRGPCLSQPNNSLNTRELYMVPATLIYEILESIPIPPEILNPAIEI
jgi:hypothetical protein